MNKWLMAATFAATGYLLAIIFAAPSLQPLLINSGIPSWAMIPFIPIAALTSMVPIDPDAGMIYIIFGGSNAILYGITGLLIVNYRVNHRHYDDDDK